MGPTLWDVRRSCLYADAAAATAAADSTASAWASGGLRALPCPATAAALDLCCGAAAAPLTRSRRLASPGRLAACASPGAPLPPANLTYIPD